jgi:hypothetical protein
MDRLRGPRWAIGHGGPAGLLTALLGLTGLVLAGCNNASTAAAPSASASSSPSSSSSSSASPGFSVPGTHRTTTTYQVSTPVSTVVVVGHTGNVTVTGGSGPSISVTQQADYSSMPPTTTRTISGNTLTVTYSCPTQVVCGVAYTLDVPRGAAVQVSTGAGTVRLSGLAGSVTARADVGLISATGLTGASASLSTNVGAISASFAAAPATVQASANVGAITLHVPGTASYKVTADAHVGKATVSTAQDPSSAHAITATTDVGAILIAPSS